MWVIEVRFVVLKFLKVTNDEVDFDYNLIFINPIV
jgi:hypothetical protein